MDDHSKTKHELIQELVSLRKRIAKQDQCESERKKVKEALHETKERFAAAFHASPNLIAITKMADGTIVDVNEGYSKLLGYSRDESIGKTTEKLSIWAHSVDRATFVGRLEKFGEVTDFVTTLRRKDGTVVTVLDSARPIELQGEKCLLSVAYDITERKQYEESLHNASLYTRSLIEVSLDPLVTINQEGRITDVNKATETVTGISRKQLVGSDFTKYFTEPEKAKAGYQQVLSEGLVRDYPLTIQHTSGSTIDVLYNATVYKNEAGQVQGVFAAARDITKRKQAEEKIKASLREKEILLRELHHRVKNNLQVISGLLDLQAKSTGNPKLTEMLQESQSRIRSMALVQEKLYDSKDFSRIGLANYVRSLSEGLFQAYNINQGKLDLLIQTNGDVNVDINKAIPCGLILNELISNALKHAFPGDRHGELQIIIRETKNAEIDIVIRDNGVGLSDNIDIHQPQTLGLELVKGLVKNQLDGQIDVRRDNGTEFQIKFPL